MAYLRVKKFSELSRKDQLQKIRCMFKKGQYYNCVPYYYLRHYLQKIDEIRKHYTPQMLKGELRVQQMVKELKQKYPKPLHLILVNPVTGIGADIIVMKKKYYYALLPYEPVHAFELTNDSRTSYISAENFERCVKTLTSSKCRRTLVVSYVENVFDRNGVDRRPILRQNDIELVVKGELRLEKNKED